LDELPEEKEINVYCTVGYRSYIAGRILSQSGFTPKNLSGGIISYKVFNLHDGIDDNAWKKLKEDFLKESPARASEIRG